MPDRRLRFRLVGLNGSVEPRHRFALFIQDILDRFSE